MFAINTKALPRQDERIILHFDYDAFYASVFEAALPMLKSRPLAVQQKQIIVTCNYEARRWGLHKLQLIKEARKICPDLIVVLGEDLTRFRDTSKELYSFLRTFSWSDRAERLGMDEVFLDVSDLINFNVDFLDRNRLSDSFFHTDRNDPTVGFTYDASISVGNLILSLPPSQILTSNSPTPGSLVSASELLELRLKLGSHLASYIRHQLEEHKGYVATVGISTNKLLAKLAGKVNKPKSQTTLMPPYSSTLAWAKSSVTEFMDSHELSEVPGLGYKICQSIRDHMNERLHPCNEDTITVRDVRLYPGMSLTKLERLLGGPGSQRGLAAKVWFLIHGVDDDEVSIARGIPRQISIEDSYIQLDSFEEVEKELQKLARSLIKRMRLDLTAGELGGYVSGNVRDEYVQRGEVDDVTHWLAHPRSIRLSTRLRSHPNTNGACYRRFNRISRSSPMPQFVSDLTIDVVGLADKLTKIALIPLFRKLHPEKSGWNLSLVNVAATNMLTTAGDSKGARGRDIAKMMRRQGIVWASRCVEEQTFTTSVDRQILGSPSETPVWKKPESSQANIETILLCNSGDLLSAQSSVATVDGWESGDDESELPSMICCVCRSIVPSCAKEAHERYHKQSEVLYPDSKHLEDAI